MKIIDNMKLMINEGQASSGQVRLDQVRSDQVSLVSCLTCFQSVFLFDLQRLRTTKICR